jgi:hypothetical protein
VMMQIRYLKSRGSLTRDVFGMEINVLTGFIFIYLFYLFIVLFFANISEVSCLAVKVPEKCVDEGSGKGQTCVLLGCDNLECFKKEIFISFFFFL